MTIDALIVGLGNPGTQYERTRHNVGWMATAALAARHGLRFSSKRMQAELATGTVAGKSVVIAQPQTFMNDSGKSVGHLVRWYKVPLTALLVVYDDVDISFGALRLRPSGSHAGHKGLGDIVQQLGTNAIPRLRIGVGRPIGGGEALGHVLKPFALPERTVLTSDILPAAADAIEAWLTTADFDTAMQHVNGYRPPVMERP